MRYVNARNTAYGEDRRSYKETDSGVSSTQRVFNVSYDNGRVEAYLNGVRLFPDDDYTKASSGIGTSITLASDLGSNNVLEIVGYQGINSGNALVEDNFVVGTDSTGSGGAYDGTSSTNSDWDDTFPVASSQGNTVSVWRNGVKLVPTTDYTVNPSANTVYLVSPAVTGDEITVQVVGGVIHNNGLTVNSGNDSFSLPTTRGTDGQVLSLTGNSGATTWSTTVQAPSITNVSGEINEDTNTTLTVSGNNFASGMTIKLINASTNADITGHTTLSYTGSSSPLTVTIPSATQNNTALGVSTSISAGLSVKLHIDKQGLTTTSTALTVSEDPNWVTNAGNIATIYSNTGTSVNVGSALSATAGAGGGTINYVIDSSDTSATTYFDLGLTSGQITTDASATLSNILGGANSATETFIAYAQIAGEEATKKAPRTFNIIVNKAPTGGTNGSGGSTLATYVDGGVTYRYHAFLSNGTFEVFNNTVCDILIVAGGGASGYHVGGGGGGGGIVTMMNYTISTGQATITVGNGGDSSDNKGDDSSIAFPSGTDTQVVQGGGYGGGWSSAEGDSGANGGGDGINNSSNYSNNTGGGGLGATGSYALLSQSGATITYYGGYDGGNTSAFYNQNYHPAAGGGGATQAGQSPSSSTSNGGYGGDGKQITWVTPDALGFTTGSGSRNNTAYNAGFYFSGGGGGSVENTATTGAGGKGGGGAGNHHSGVLGSTGSYSINEATHANAGTGNHGGANTGGGAGGNYQSGQINNGGSGIVVIRYAI